MVYVAWSVVFGEQPSAAKWNILGANDAAFANGTGVAALSWAVTQLTNPYKFSAYRNGVLTAATGAWTALVLDAESYDSNSNFNISTGKYVAPIAGFYQFDAQLTIATNSTTVVGLSIYKNGAVAAQLYYLNFTSANASTAMAGGKELQLAANDEIQLYYYSNGAAAISTGAAYSSLQGHLISQL